MNTADAIYTLLSTRDPIVALVAGRIHKQILPKGFASVDGTGFPLASIVFSRIGGEGPAWLDAPIRTCTFDVKSYAPTPPLCSALDDAIRASLHLQSPLKAGNYFFGAIRLLQEPLDSEEPETGFPFVLSTYEMETHV